MSRYQSKLSKKEQIQNMALEYPYMTIKEADQVKYDFKTPITLDMLLIQESSEEDYQFKARIRVTKAIQDNYPDYNLNTIVVLGHMLCKKKWIGIIYDDKYEKLLNEIIEKI